MSANMLNIECAGSSAICQMEWNPKSKNLFVKYSSSPVIYIYRKVSRQTVDELCRAGSKGEVVSGIRITHACLASTNKLMPSQAPTKQAIAAQPAPKAAQPAPKAAQPTPKAAQPTPKAAQPTPKAQAAGAKTLSTADMLDRTANAYYSAISGRGPHPDAAGRTYEYDKALFGAWKQQPENHSFLGGHDVVFNRLRSAGKLAYTSRSLKRFRYDFECSGRAKTSEQTEADLVSISPVVFNGGESVLPGATLSASAVIRYTGTSSGTFLTGIHIDPTGVVTTTGTVRAAAAALKAGFEVGLALTAPANVGDVKVCVRFTFSAGSGNFYIDRFVGASVSGDEALRKALAPVSPYVKRRVARLVSTDTSGYKIFRSAPLRVEGSAKYVRKLDEYKVGHGQIVRIASGEVENTLQAGKSALADATVSGGTPAGAVAAYVGLFEELLDCEDVCAEKEIRAYDQSAVPIKVAGTLVAVPVPGLAENRPSVVLNDRLLLKVTGDASKDMYEGYVHSVEERAVRLMLNSAFSAVQGMRVDVTFCANRTAIKEMHRALQHLGSPAMHEGVRRLLFPDSTSVRRESLTTCALGGASDLFDRNLNEQQRQAVATIVAGDYRPLPFVLFGPPGTGKSVTLVEAIFQIRHSNPTARILVCAPSNEAVDVVVQRLAIRLKPCDMLRLTAISRPSKKVPEEVMKFCTLSDDGSSFVIPKKADILNKSVVCCTVSYASRLYSVGMDQHPFDYVIVDEAGQSVEPSLMCCVAGLTSADSAVIVAGDPKQLGPIVLSDFARQFGLGVSYLERIVGSSPAYSRHPTSGYDSSLIVRLSNCYRSHPDIIKVPNELFYENDLVACVDPVIRDSFLDWRGLPNSKFPLIFHGVVGENVREASSPSWFNVAEVEVVVRYVTMLLEDKAKLASLQPSQIGIVTPYERQVFKIRQALAAKKLQGVCVGSVEQFQGQEKRVIIVSTVRSNSQFLGLDKAYNLGFVANEKRFNVAVTRAKSLLIVIGNPDILSRDRCWSRLLWHCVDNSAYTGCSIATLSRTSEEEEEEDEVDALDSSFVNISMEDVKAQQEHEGAFSGQSSVFDADARE